MNECTICSRPTTLINNIYYCIYFKVMISIRACSDPIYLKIKLQRKLIFLGALRKYDTVSESSYTVAALERTLVLTSTGSGVTLARLLKTNPGRRC